MGSPSVQGPFPARNICLGRQKEMLPLSQPPGQACVCGSNPDCDEFPSRFSPEQGEGCGHHNDKKTMAMFFSVDASRGACTFPDVERKKQASKFDRGGSFFLSYVPQKKGKQNDAALLFCDGWQGSQGKKSYYSLSTSPASHQCFEVSRRGIKIK